jgi:hypothetical protein
VRTARHQLRLFGRVIARDPVADFMNPFRP